MAPGRSTRPGAARPTPTGRANAASRQSRAVRAVVDGAGERWLLLTAGAEESLVRDVATGDRREVPTADLTPLPAGPLAAIADPVPEPPPSPLDRAPSDQGLGLLVELHAAGPRSVRGLLAGTSLCESDLHGLVADLRAGGLVRETTVAGRRGYGLTPAAGDALAALEG